MANTWIQAGSEEAAQLEAKIPKLQREYSLADLLKRPELNYRDLADIKGKGVDDERVSEQVEIAAKYSGYIERQQQDIDRLRAHENTVIPSQFDYEIVQGLSNEVKQKLQSARPETLARAARLPGITPAAISLILVYLKKQGALKKVEGV